MTPQEKPRTRTWELGVYAQPLILDEREFDLDAELASATPVKKRSTGLLAGGVVLTLTGALGVLLGMSVQPEPMESNASSPSVTIQEAEAPATPALQVSPATPQEVAAPISIETLPLVETGERAEDKALEEALGVIQEVKDELAVLRNELAEPAPSTRLPPPSIRYDAPPLPAPVVSGAVLGRRPAEPALPRADLSLTRNELVLREAARAWETKPNDLAAAVGLNREGKGYFAGTLEDGEAAVEYVFGPTLLNEVRVELSSVKGVENALNRQFGSVFEQDGKHWYTQEAVITLYPVQQAVHIVREQLENVPMSLEGP